MTMSFQLEGLRFGVVGSLGFLIDGGLLWLLVSYGADPYLTRAVSFPAAVIVTWWCNRIWTFPSPAQNAPVSQFNRYFAVQALGAASNFIVYSLCLKWWGETVSIAGLGFVLGSSVGLVVNFIGAKAFVFR